ncbi:MAG: hypothetical protein Q8J74_10630 [Candidatus Didemnitutus sp.]|nr:hypothetical protein [Candidatus Didemnitutus sp.]
MALLTLCLVAVMAISLASYIALSARAMTQANRSFQSGLAAQQAESGIVQALWSLNNANWTNWTAPGGGALTAADTSAVRTIAFASSKFGTSGVTASIKLRVNNRHAAEWNQWTAYTTANMVWYRGRWWQCVTAHGPVLLSATPNTSANWISAPGTWSALVSYSVGDIVISNGLIYRCTAAHTNRAPPNASFWTNPGVAPTTWNAVTAYAVNAVVLHGGTLYRCRAAHTNQVPPNTSFWVSAPVIYSEGVSTPPANLGGGASRLQIRAELAPVSLVPNAIGANTSNSPSVSFGSTGVVGSYVPAELAAAATVWSPSPSYAVGDLVLHNTGYYRCTTAHSSSSSRAPPTASFWSGSLLQGYSAVVAGSSVTISNATSIFGFVASPTTSFASSAVVKKASSPASPNRDPQQLSSSYFVPVLGVQSVTDGINLPTGGTNLPDGANTLGNATDTTPRIYNITGTWDGSNLRSGVHMAKSADILTIAGPVILNVSGALYTNDGQIIVEPAGSLEIYFSGQLWIGNNSTSGTPPVPSRGGIVNQTLNPRRLLIVGTSNYNSSSYNYYWSIRPFHGVIYMPNAYVHMWNSGYTNLFFGAISASTVYFNHTANLQYDSSLRTAGKLGRFIDPALQITSWRELTDPSERINL